MQEAARGLASFGRYGDDTLLHVSRKELQGLRALTGKDFTRNPETGLPEAFSWRSLIPVAAGIAGTAVGGPLGGALASGAASTAVGAAEGKSIQQALTQGLISGVTSYAGGQLLAGVGDPAGQAAAQGAAAQGAAAQGAAQALPGAGGAVAVEPLGAAGAEAAAQGATTIPAQAGAGLPSVPQAAGAAPPPAASPGFGEKLASAGTRFENIVSDPGKAFEQIGANVKKDPYSALIAAGGTYAQAMDALAPKPYQYKDTYDPSKYPEQFPGSPRSWNAPPSDYQAGTDPEYRYFAKGGLASMRPEGSMTANIMNEAKAALLGEHPRPREAIERFENMFGQDALSALRDRITGGRVRGAGGGMDDLVPGSIEGRQQVRLADGEFVVPADVVSGLGDGSTDQGVRRLHEMMGKVRQQRTGKPAQPKAIGGKISL